MSRDDPVSARVAALTQVISKGVAATDLYRLEALADVRSVRQRLDELDHPRPDEVSAVVREVVRQAVDQGLSGKERERAQMLMGLGDYQAHGHQERRRAFAETYGPKLRWADVRQTHAKHVLREIAQAMVGRLLPPPSDHARERGYADWAENQYWLDERRVITLMESRRRVRAVRDGIDQVTYKHSYYANPGHHVLRVGRVWGALIENEMGVQRGYLRVDLSLGKALGSGEEHSFGYEVRVSTDVPAHTLIQTDGYSEETLLRCMFHPDELPAKVWSFRNLAVHDAPGTPDQGSALNLDLSGMACDTFGPVSAGKASGIGLEW